MIHKAEDQANIVNCKISSTAMDQFAGTKGTMPSEREAQFLSLRDGIERIASDLFDMTVPKCLSGKKLNLMNHL